MSGGARVGDLVVAVVSYQLGHRSAARRPARSRPVAPRPGHDACRACAVTADAPVGVVPNADRSSCSCAVWSPSESCSCLAVVAVGGAVVLAGRAEAAADGAALAAADTVALGNAPAGLCRRERRRGDRRRASRRVPSGAAAPSRWSSSSTATGRRAFGRTVRARSRAEIDFSSAASRRRSGDRAALVEVLVPVPALRRLHARRAAVVARARGDELERRARRGAAAASNASSAMPAPPG